MMRSLILSKEERFTDWLHERIAARSVRFPDHSVVFDAFPPRTISVPDGLATDYMGNMWPTRFGFAPSPGTYETQLPPLHEEYFEITDVFESVLDARRSYTILEWGAGFARWSSLAVAAARDAGIERITVGCVEAHPLHMSYITENFRLMGLSSFNTRLFPYALGAKEGSEYFIIEQPEPSDQPGTWYGQALATSASMVEGWVPSGREYEGQPELINPNGWRAIEVPVVPATRVLQNYSFVDLIDMDLQGAEADVVDESIEMLNARVRRLHIGTHGHEIEDRLRVTLAANGWIKLRDLPCHTETETIYGPVHCVDGVQSWFNPRFPPPKSGAGMLGLAGMARRAWNALRY